MYVLPFALDVRLGECPDNFVPDKEGYLKSALPISLCPRFLIDQLQPYIRLRAFVTSHDLGHYSVPSSGRTW